MTDMDVCLLLEGTYPFVTGGVSSWVHTLITELKHLRFGVVHISPREGYFPHGYSYTLPDNVVEVREVYLHQYKLPKKASRDSIREQIQLFRGFIQDLQDGNTEAFRDFCSAVNQDLGGGLNAASIFQTKESWDVLVESYSQEAAEESFINYFWTWRYALFPLFNILAAQLPEAHLYHTISTGYAGMLAAGATLRRGRPMVLTEHGIYAKERRIEIHRADWIQDWSSGEIVAERKPPFFKRFWTRQFAMMSKVTYAHANEIYTLYEGNRRTQIQDGAEPERTNVIPNGIDLVRYGEAAKTFDARAENERFTLAFVGRVSPIKDLKTFLRAVRLVANEVPNVRARILGPMDEDPKYADACKKLFQRLHLDGIAAFEGKVNVLEEFPKIDLLVLTSISEAQPLVILEAGAVGIPTVTTDVGSCSELLNGSSPEDRALGSGGLLTPIASPGETAKAILQLIRDRDQLKRMGRSMRERVHRFYALHDMIAAYGDIYGKFQPGGRCYDGRVDEAKSAEMRAERPVENPVASATPPVEVMPPAEPAIALAEPLTADTVIAGAVIADAVIADEFIVDAGIEHAGIQDEVPDEQVCQALVRIDEPAASATPSDIEVSYATVTLPTPWLAAPADHEVPLFVESALVPLVVLPQSNMISAACVPTVPLLIAPRFPNLAHVQAAWDQHTQVALAEASCALESASTNVVAPETNPLGRLLEMQQGVAAWVRITAELHQLLKDAEPSAETVDAADAIAAAANTSEDDEIELGEDDVPADLALSCEALLGGEIETRFTHRAPQDLGLELIDDLMRELGSDADALRSALQREAEEIAQFEQELICLDETEKLAADLHGPVQSGAQVWWSQTEEADADTSAEVDAPDDASEALASIATTSPETTLAPDLPVEIEEASDVDTEDAAECDESEESEESEESDEFDLGDEDQTIDLPLSCEVLLEGRIESKAKRRGDDDLGLELIDDLMREIGADAESLLKALQREAEEIAQFEQELICLDETEKLAADLHGPVPSGAQVWWTQAATVDPSEEQVEEEEEAAAAEEEVKEAAETHPTTTDPSTAEDETADGPPIIQAETALAQDEELDVADPCSAEATEFDEFDLGDDDCTMDLPLSCEALLDGKIETKARRRHDDDLGLELVDDLMREIGADAKALRAALEREAEEFAQFEADVICLDETERIDDAEGAPVHPSAIQEGLQLLAEEVGDDGQFHFAALESTAAEELELTAEVDQPTEEDEDEEVWLQFEEEDLPRDMPLHCSAFGDSSSDSDDPSMSSLDEEEPV